jgi:N4-gp56 family major capsid protein
MTLNNFIPQVWSSRLLSNLNKSHVFGQSGVVNRDYEGEISAAGDTVKINSIGRVTVFDYTKNTDMTAAETLTDAQRTLTIDQAKAFNFQIDDVDKAQQKPKVMDEAMREAAYALADTLDVFLAGKYADAAAANIVGLGDDTTPIAVNSANAYDQLVLMDQRLDEANVRKDGRWCIVPPWFHAKLQLDNRFINAAASADGGSTLRNGQVGRASGFDIYESNNVFNTAGAKYKIMAGTDQAISLAEQIASVEAYRPQLRFGDAVKGLHLYGAKTVRPEALTVCTANAAAEA